MPSPKDGKAGDAVPPAEPPPANEADKADPGKVEEIKAAQRQTQTGKYGAVQIQPYKPSDDPEKTSWIEIEMVDEDQHGVVGQRYRLTLPDGASVAEGTLDDKGCARVAGIEPGTCKITFPDLDKDAWEKI